MPKLQNLTAEDLAAVVSQADALFFDIQHAAEDIRKGATDKIEQPLEKVSTLISLSRIAADLAGAIITRKQMYDDREELAESLRAQIAGKRAYTIAPTATGEFYKVLAGKEPHAASVFSGTKEACEAYVAART